MSSCSSDRNQTLFQAVKNSIRIGYICYCSTHEMHPKAINIVQINAKSLFFVQKNNLIKYEISRLADETEARLIARYFSVICILGMQKILIFLHFIHICSWLSFHTSLIAPIEPTSRVMLVKKKNNKNPKCEKFIEFHWVAPNQIMGYKHFFLSLVDHIYIVNSK